MPRQRKEPSIEDAQRMLETNRKNYSTYYERMKHDEEFMAKRRAYYKEYNKKAYHEGGNEKKKEYYEKNKEKKKEYYLKRKAMLINAHPGA